MKSLVALCLVALIATGCGSISTVQIGKTSREEPSFLFLEGVAEREEVNNIAKKACGGEATLKSVAPASNPPRLGDWKEATYSCTKH